MTYKNYWRILRKKIADFLTRSKYQKMFNSLVRRYQIVNYQIVSYQIEVTKNPPDVLGCLDGKSEYFANVKENIFFLKEKIRFVTALELNKCIKQIK